MKKSSVLIIAALMLMSFTAQAKPLKGKVLFLDFSKPVAEQSKTSVSIGLSGVSGGRSFSLLTLEGVLETAAGDNDIAMIYMRPDKLSAAHL